MQQAMMESHQLLTLCLQMTSRESGKGISIKLQDWTGGKAATLYEQVYPIDSLGLPLGDSAKALSMMTSGDISFTLPPGLADQLQQNATRLSTEGTLRPLWLQFRQPYGYLAALPWEKAIGLCFQAPILRLPMAFTPDPAEHNETLDVVICASMPPDEQRYPVVEHILQVAEAVLGGCDRQVEVHVFADTDIGATLGQRAMDPRIRLYSAQGYKSQSEHPEPLRSVWLRWIRDTLFEQDRMADCVVFIAHGIYDEGRGAIALAARPWSEKDSRHFYATDLIPFLREVGAWCCGFSAPACNNSGMGHRALVDELAQKKPAPLFFHNLPEDPQCAALHEAIRFLFSVTSGSAPPAAPGMTLYSQPFRGLAPRQLIESVPPRIAEKISKVATSWASAANASASASMPAWQIMAQRYLEDRRYELLQRYQTAATNKGEEYLVERTRALDELQSLLSSQDWSTAPPSHEERNDGLHPGAAL